MKKMFSVIALLFVSTCMVTKTTYAETNDDQMVGEATIEILPKNNDKGQPTDPVPPPPDTSGKTNGNTGNGLPTVPNTGANGSGISKTGIFPSTNELVNFTYSFVGTLALVFLILLIILRRRKDGAEDES